MQDMRYEAPKTLAAAVDLLANATGQTKVLAGGTDLLIQMRGGRADPALIVDVKHIPEMTSITNEGGSYRFGAAVPCMVIGSIQVRGRATVGGNLCNASPAADTVPAMIAAGATAVVYGPKGKREVPIEEIATGPGKTSLAKGELVASFVLPKRPPRSGDAYLRFIPRTEMDIAVVGAGISLTLDAAGTCTHARVSIGAVAERALLVADAAKALIGTKVDEAALKNMAAAVSAACRPIDDKRGTKEYRIKVSGVMARRAAEIALKRAREAK